MLDKKNIALGGLALSLLFASCKATVNDPEVMISNPTSVDRLMETVKVKIDPSLQDKAHLVAENKETGEKKQVQIIDDTALFQVALKAKQHASFALKEAVCCAKASQDCCKDGKKVTTFGRFVPERTDDFTWENDRVAFRVYGPEAQRMVEEGEKGGTLSGGVDCWLKKVDYSIIDKWYADYVNKTGSYHKDTGEGLDNYHVGPSLGCGGTGVMVDGQLATSLNYTNYKVLSNGPIETTFVLNHAPFGEKDHPVTQTKTASIDLGNNFTKFVVEVTGTDTLTTGITLHDKIGEIAVNQNACWGDYWSPHFGEELGTAIVVEPKYFAGYSEVKVDAKDKSHLLMHLKVIDGKVEYYSGFAWSASKQFANKKEWHNYLTTFAQQIQNPLVVEAKQ